MKTLRALNLIALHVCFLSVCNVGSASTKLCDRLLASAMQARSADRNDTTLSDSGRDLLRLIDIGITNLGPEVPGLLKNLRLLVTSDHAINPFLDLPSNLAHALAARVESTLHMRPQDWNLVQERVSIRLKSAGEVESKRQEDQDTTHAVSGFHEIPFPMNSISKNISPTIKDLMDLDYLGQTERYFILQERISVSATGGIFKMSRSDGSISEIGQFPAPNKDIEGARWIKDGIIYGVFNLPNGKLGPSGQPMAAKRLFSVDPETGASVWAEPWDDSRHVFFHVNQSNTVVGVKLDQTGEGSGEIFRLEEKLMRFVPTGMRFDESPRTFPNQKREFDILHDIVSVPPNSPVIIGRFLKTDGQTMVRAGDSAEWRNWAIEEGLKTTEKKSKGKSQVTIQKLDVSYPNRWPYERHEQSKSGKQIQFGYDAQGMDLGSNSLIQSVDKGQFLLHAHLVENLGIVSLLLIEQDSWDARPVSLTNGPPATSVGQWRMFRNQADEVLLQYRTLDGHPQVALWVYNVSKGTFDLKVHEVFTYNEADPIEVFVDYQKKEFVAWVLDTSLVIKRPVSLSRDEALSRSEKGSP